MKEDHISGIRNLITNKGHSQNMLNVNVLGSLQLIGFLPSLLIKGKKLYKNLLDFIEENKMLQNLSLEQIDKFTIERLSLVIKSGDWQRNKLVFTDDFISEMEEYGTGKRVKSKHTKRQMIYKNIQYGIIERKPEKTEITNEDIQLTNLLNEFEKWLNEYIAIFPKNCIDKYNLSHLLRIIVSK